MNSFWRGKRVFVTGHTGFKGSWLSLWLLEAGAKVYGFALAPDATQGLFNALELRDETDHAEGDVRDTNSVGERVAAVQPDIVFHLAAQSLVRHSYVEPLTTWQTNVVGTVNVMEALRRLDGLCAAVVITTDKVYENREWAFAYREIDELGGYDPYSSSKAAAELAVQSWRRSFFKDGSAVRIASARAGNVIGGGDRSKDRIVPDLVAALASRRAALVRNPHSVRPWQHVLEPLGGYLRLAQLLYEHSDVQLQDAFNFGPHLTDVRTVRDLVEGALKYWPGEWSDASRPGSPHEAKHLGLTIDKARAMLGWGPKWTFDDAVRETMTWYRKVEEGGHPREITLEQIRRYASA